MPRTQLDTGTLVESIVRLRRASRSADGAARDEIESVLTYLEDATGPTVSRAQAARLLGISQTALDRWIGKGEISAVVTPAGRREVPFSELVGLLEDLEARRGEAGPLAVASIIRERRRRADDLDPDELLPSRRARSGTHRSAELQALAYHRAVAHRLDEPLVRDALRRLRRWREAGRIDRRWAEEWERLLAMPIPRIAKAIASDTERARELRQSSPFAGALTEQERRRLVRAVEQRVT